MNDNKLMKDEREFDSWRSTHYSGGGGSQQEGYQMSYYPGQPAPAIFPYSESLQSSASQPWSNGSENMTFLSQYEPNNQSGHAYTMEAMFGSQNTYGFGSAMANTIQSPFNAFFPSNSDPFWNSSKNRNPYRMHETPDSYNYHHSDNYQINDPLKHVDTAIAGLTLDHIKASEQFSNKTISGPFSQSEPKKFESMGSSSGAVGQIPKKMTWASIASQPAKPQPKSLKSKMSSSVLTGSTSKHLPPTSMETIGTWEAKNGSTAQNLKTPPTPPQAPPQQQQQSRAVSLAPIASPQQQQWSARQQMSAQQRSGFTSGAAVAESCVPLPAHPVLDKLRVENNYNPKEFDLNPKNARFFIIKSYSEDDIHRSIKYSIWCSTEHGNKRLDNAFKQQHDKGPIYLLFSVNGSGHFCGMAQMMSFVDYNSSSNVWAQDKWKGQFRVKWIYVKDVPNAQLRHIRLENNENKPVTNSRDTQEVPFEKGKQVIKIMHHYRHTTSIFDDFLHYEKRQEEESQRRVEPGPEASNATAPPPPPPPHKRQWKN